MSKKKRYKQTRTYKDKMLRRRYGKYLSEDQKITLKLNIGAFRKAFAEAEGMAKELRKALLCMPVIPFLPVSQVEFIGGALEQARKEEERRAHDRMIAEIRFGR